MIIEETYRVLNKFTGRDVGLIIVETPLNGGPSLSEIKIVPLNGRMVEAGEYALDFVKRLQIEPTTRRRFAPIAINENRGVA